MAPSYLQQAPLASDFSVVVQNSYKESSSLEKQREFATKYNQHSHTL